MTLAKLTRTTYLIPDIQQKAYLLSRQHPDCTQALIQRWLANREQYSNA